MREPALIAKTKAMRRTPQRSQLLKSNPRPSRMSSMLVSTTRLSLTTTPKPPGRTTTQAKRSTRPGSRRMAQTRPSPVSLIAEAKRLNRPGSRTKARTNPSRTSLPKRRAPSHTFEQKKKLAECIDTSSGFLTAPSEVPDQVPEREAKKRGLKHQVHAGQGMEYRHRLGVPLYKDTMENPYAVFRFKYRTRETLKKMDSRREVDWEKVKKREEQKKLMSLSKEELVEQLMKNSSISGKSSSVKQSVKAPSDTGHKSVKSWLQTVPEATSSKKSENKSKSSSGEPTTCDICKKILDYGADKWWHCDACSFDMCLSCTKDNWCKDKDHRLEKWGGSCAAGNGQFLNKTTGEQGVTEPVNSPNKKSGSQNGKPASHHSGSHGGKSRAGSAQKEPEEPAEQWEPIVGFDSANEKAGQW
ncbi:hypothetical protein IWX47DRAFT_498358 [Phyllosticta citricarpa]